MNEFIFRVTLDHLVKLAKKVTQVSKVQLEIQVPQEYVANQVLMVNRANQDRKVFKVDQEKWAPKDHKVQSV